jgi:GAF domain-containing protein
VASAATVPAWVFVAAIGIMLVGAIVPIRRQSASANLAWHAVGMHEQCLQHLAQTLDTLQHVLTDVVDGADISDYIDHGILAPAKDMLTHHPADEVRLSILVPEGERFRMRFSAGHSLVSARKFSVPIKDSISRVAFDAGEAMTWHDVHEDDCYTEHPKATRQTRAMISVPLTRGEEVTGVFNAISDRPHGFNPADRLYIECLGSVIDVAIAIMDPDAALVDEQLDPTE